MLYKLLNERMSQFKNQTIADEESSMTYAEIISFIESFSKNLKISKIGILCKSEMNTGLGLLACFKAGVTAIPLSIRYGEAHINRIIKCTELSHVITDESGKLEVKQIGEITVEKEDLSDVALIMCTSGTTGSPKGAMITEENLITNLLDIEKYFKIKHSDTILIARPLYHCAVLTGEFLISLYRGLNIRFYSGEFNPIRLIGEIYKQQATVLGGTPTLYYHLCQIAARSKEHLPLRVAAVSGECMTETAAIIMRTALPDTSIYNVYGLTEASPRVSALFPEQFDVYPLSVGYSLKNVEVKTENGELLIRGKTVMKGYFNDFYQTAKALSGGWLHTGDGAEIGEEGKITIKGRLDNMIIRAGMNIFPQEIENILKADPRITEALVYGDQSGVTQRLCMKIKADGLSKANILSICRERLPAYEIPDVVDIVDVLPRNASGKLLRPKVVMAS